MADNSKLYISISDDRGNGNTNVPTDTNKASKETEEKDNALGRYAEHELFHLVKKTAMQATEYSLSNIGNFTGDYITQRRVNEAKQAVSGLISVSMTTLAGAKYGLPGAVIGFIVGASSLVAGEVYDNITNKVEYAKQNYSISQLRNRAGLNTIYDGSRGTEN